MKLVTVQQMRALEQAAVAAGVSEAQLIENAGVAVAQETWINMGAAEGRSAVVLVGTGNNGADGLATARNLSEWGAEVSVLLLQPRPGDDPHWQAVQAANIEAWTVAEDPGLQRLAERLRGAHGIIDALLGTGLSRPISGDLAAVLDRVAEVRANRTVRPHLIAIDLPSGIDPDSGQADPAVVRV
ncbi:MAG: NAD(P)H-hydrate epimerase, partial [Chloroflexi bacterium]|nr:NAD(P)H-hydrate epimerase [Chloroflexota bacterium]